MAKPTKHVDETMEILRIIGEKSVKNGTDKLTSKQIDKEIKAARAAWNQKQGSLSRIVN